MSDLSQPLYLPLPFKPRQPRLPREELLHGGPLDGPLLLDQRIQRPDEPVGIGEGAGYGALFGEGG